MSGNRRANAPDPGLSNYFSTHQKLAALYYFRCLDNATFGFNKLLTFRLPDPIDT